MGQVAREHGFDHKFLSALCEPELGLDTGCAVFATKLSSTRGTTDAAGGDVTRALQLWNGGANPNYAAQVLARLVKYR
jgi:hypothetical protein